MMLIRHAGGCADEGAWRAWMCVTSTRLFKSDCFTLREH